MYKRIAAVMFVALESLTLFFTPSYAHEGINYRLPTLESIVPPAFSIIDTGTVDISGRIVTELNILSLRIDGKPVKFSGSKFTISNLPLSIGKNVFLFEILDSTGKRKFYSYSLYRKERLKEEAAPLPEAAGTHEPEIKNPPSTTTAIVAEGFTPPVITSPIITPKSSAIAPATAPTPATSGYSIKNDNSQVVSVVQQITGGFTSGADAVNNPNPQTDVAQTQTPVPDNKDDNNNGEPTLSFSSPYEGQIITENALQIGGRFSGTAHVNSLTIGGQKCTIDSASATFTGPTLISPGEARRQKVESDSEKYIIMKVDPATHSGKNILTAQMTDDAGHITEEKVTFYYYQLLVKSVFEYRNPTFPERYIPDENEEWWNADLLKDSPFSDWENLQTNLRWCSPGYAWRYSFSETNYYPYMDVTEYEYLNKEDSEGNRVRVKYCLTLKTYLSFHTLPQTDPGKKTPMVVIFKDCTMLENNGNFPGHPLPVIGAKYKVEFVDLNWLATRTRYNYYGQSDRDEQDYYIVLEDYIPDTDKVLKVEGTFIEDNNSGLDFCQKAFQFTSMDTLTGDILVDSNNDGFLGGDDNAVEQVAPGCVLWVNDDDDYDESTVHQDDPNNDYTRNINSFGNDGADNVINGIRDLEDFMPINLTISGIKEWATNQNIKFYLKAEGSGRIKIYERVTDLDTYGEYSYLKDLNSSKAQYKKPMLLDIVAGDKKELDPKYFNDNGNFHGIFEGVEQGALKLSLIAELGVGPNKKDTVVLDEVFITLKDIRHMYKVENIREGPTNENGLLRYINRTESGEMFAPDSKRVFIWTHGYNNTFEGSLGSADVVYKRLYRTGFRGSFFLISWKTADWIQPFSAANFNGDWVNSFRSARITADIIKDIRGNYPYARIDIGAHSLGNSLMCYALRLFARDGNSPIDNFIMTEPAVPGEVFNGPSRNPIRDLLGFRNDGGHALQTCSFLKFLVSDDKSLVLGNHRHSWKWQKI